MSPRMPDYMKQGTIDQQRRWHAAKATERRGIRERVNVELEVKLGKPETTLSAPREGNVEPTLTGGK